MRREKKTRSEVARTNRHIAGAGVFFFIVIPRNQERVPRGRSRGTSATTCICSRVSVSHQFLRKCVNGPQAVWRVARTPEP